MSASQALKKEHRYWDSQAGAYTVTVLPGKHYLTSAKDEVISTLLGSCVAACIFDLSAGWGGLNHFLLPCGGPDEPDLGDTATRYGNYAMEALINDLLKQGARRENITVKVFGGANVIETSSKHMIGSRNADFVLEFLKAEKFRVSGQHLGGDRPRRILFNPTTGKVQMQLLKRSAAKMIEKVEKGFNANVKQSGLTGTVELFS